MCAGGPLACVWCGAGSSRWPRGWFAAVGAAGCSTGDSGSKGGGGGVAERAPGWRCCGFTLVILRIVDGCAEGVGVVGGAPSVQRVGSQAIGALLRCGSAKLAGASMSYGEATRAQGGRRMSVGVTGAVGGVERGAAACEHREMLAEVWGSCCSRSRSTSSGRRAQQCSEWPRRRCGAREQRQGATGDLRRERMAVCTRRWCYGGAVVALGDVGAPLPESGPPSLPQTSPTGALSVSERRSLDERASTTNCFCNVCCSPYIVKLEQTRSTAVYLSFSPGPAYFLPVSESHLPVTQITWRALARNASSATRTGLTTSSTPRRSSTVHPYALSEHSTTVAKV